MIEVKNVYKYFNNRPIIENINLVFEPGKVNLIIGKSGSGKTVLMKCLVGLHEPDKGDVFFDQRNFYAISDKERKNIRQEIGMLFQGAALFDYFTVEENVKYPLDMFTNMTSGEKRERVDFCLEHVGLSGQNNLYPSELSGGMKKRAGIARAIVCNPKYLFCDEPNSGLDPQTSILIDELIYQLTNEFNMTTVMNTHDLNSVITIGDYITYIYHGQTWWQGNKNEVLYTDNVELDQFIYAQPLTQKIKEAIHKK